MGTKFGGTVMGESAMVNTSDVGSLVEFTFNVSHLQSILNLQGFNASSDQMCGCHPHVPHPHPVFEDQTAGVLMSKVDCLSCGLWCEQNQGYF